jgi:hypothetical protein
MLRVPAKRGEGLLSRDETKRISRALGLVGKLAGIVFQTWPAEVTAGANPIADLRPPAGSETGVLIHSFGCPQCSVCGWVHDPGFNQIKLGRGEVVFLRGVLPAIVALVHEAHAQGFDGLSSKDDRLRTLCGGYRHPCKAFDDLDRRREYHLLFDTSRRGLLSLRGAVGMNRNKSEPRPE